MAMNVFSLFSGIGGFDLGFQRAGMEVVGMCERDAHAQKVLSRRFPGVPIVNDVREVSIERGSVDLICGGFPCQDISVSGKRAGLAGDRSGLWWEFARIVDEAQPQWVVIENVPGLFSSSGGRDFTAIVSWLVHRGYGVGWRVLDAQGFGLAQRRKRVFIVASFGTPRGCTLLLDKSGEPGVLDASRAPGEARAGAVVDASPEREGLAERYARAWKMRVTGCNTTGERGGRLKYPGGQGYLESRKSFTLSTTHDQHVTVEVGPGQYQVRRFTPVECERLQGFPDGWTDNVSDTQRYKQLGNAVAVPVAEWVGRRIMDCR
jgi:DNA (cytosine-5)-methyltransferase 1